MKKIKLNSIYNLVIYALLFTFLVVLLLPINPQMPGSNIDDSWHFTMNYALINKFRFGEDIIFTFGPLADFWFPSYFYSESTYKLAFSISLLLALTIFFSLYFFTKESDLFSKSLGLATIAIGLMLGRYLMWYIIPMLFVLFAMNKNNPKIIFKFLSVILTFFLSFSILIKFSHFPTAILSVIFIDVLYFYRYKNKVPFYTILLIIFMIFLFVMSGQNIVDFISYFIGSFQTLSGYSESMQITGSKPMIYIFLILSLGMCIPIFKYLLSYKKIEDIIFVLVCSLILFMSFKSGFIRHDGHAIDTFSGLAFTFGLLFIYFNTFFKESSTKYAFVSLLVFISLLSSIAVIGHYTNQSLTQLIYEKKTNLKDDTKRLMRVLSDERIKELNDNYRIRVDKIRKEFPLNDINTTVDIYPWDQSFVIANGLNFKPRPLFQSYSVYNPYLIEKNIEFLKSNRAPQTILFSIKEIDGRAPFMMEGASWLEIIKRYDVIDLKGEYLVLKKTNDTKNYSLEASKNLNVRFGDEIQVPKGQYVYVSVDIKKSFLGKIINTLFKSPILSIELTFNNGKKERYRIIPGIASSGFILNPSIRSVGDFFSFSIGKNLSKHDVQSFKIINDSNCCYINNIKILFSKINTNNFIISSKISDNFKKLNLHNEIINMNETLEAQSFQLETYKNEAIIFSHVGVKFNVSGKLLVNLFNDSKQVEIKYSIKEEAYTKGANSEGACFAIYEDNKLIKNNCINPKDVEGDREVKSFILENIDLNKNYAFEVTPRATKSSAYGWSYWQF